MLLIPTGRYSHLKEFKNHEQVISLDDADSGLKGFIAIHSTAIGPALGGTRIFPYKSQMYALKDVLRLSWAMTYKCAIAGVKFGGGKGVIIANPKQKNLRKILRVYAQKVNELKGKFHTGEDVGLSEANVQYMLKFSPYFIGKSHLAGDPSPYAGLSAFLCAQVALNYKLGSGVKGKTFAVKGVGKTGSEFAKLAYKAGAKVIISDIDSSRVKYLLRKFPGMRAVSPTQIQKQQCDVYSPCAMGDDVSLSTAKKIQTSIICGTANNQLSGPEVAEALYKRAILCVPDYLANAGGLIDVSAELWPGGFTKPKVIATIQKLKTTLKAVLTKSDKAHKNPNLEAGLLAEQFIEKNR
jgi:leucine dehydrogenase